jgi:hypothetical protein
VYGWVWRRLPGSRGAKAAEALGLLVVVVLVLFLWVFPWLEPRLPFNEVTVDQPATSVPSQIASPTSSVFPSP